jgi:hypothetical protein
MKLVYLGLGLALALSLAAPASFAQSSSHPDLTGTWMAPFRVHESGLPMGSGVSPWIPVSAGDPSDLKLPTLDEISARVDAVVKANNGNPISAQQRPPPPPLTPAGEAAAKAIDRKKLEAQELACYPTNVMSRIGGGPIQIVQNEKAVAIMSEGGAPGRTIFLDGRTNDNAIPMWNGHSIGHWEGDALKVETVAMRGGLFQGGNPMSDQAKLTEEYRLSRDGKQLILRVTFEDRTFYKEPLRKIAYLDRKTDVEVTDFTCQEGKDDMIETEFTKHGAEPVENIAPGRKAAVKTKP